MKKDIHPSDYRQVVVQDPSAGFAFLTKSTAKTAETIKWEDGKEYPLLKVHISSASHPFYTGQEKLIDVEGRVDKFKARQKVAQKNLEEKRKRIELQKQASLKKKKSSPPKKSEAEKISTEES